MERVAGRGRRCECGERCSFLGSFLEDFETKGPVEVPTTTSTSLHLRRSSASDAVFSTFPPSPSLSVFHTPACGPPGREDEDRYVGRARKSAQTRIGRGGGKHVGLKARSGHHRLEGRVHNHALALLPHHAGELHAARSNVELERVGQVGDAEAAAPFGRVHPWHVGNVDSLGDASHATHLIAHHGSVISDSLIGLVFVITGRTSAAGPE